MERYGILTEHEVEVIEKALAPLSGYGHEDFKGLALKELLLHAAKNSDYAKGGDSLGNFTRVAAILALYPGLDLSDRRVVALAYALKQLDAVLWGLCKKIAHKVEGLNERLGDISIYAKIVTCMNIEDARNAEIDRQFAQDKALQTAQLSKAAALREESDRILSRVRVSAGAEPIRHDFDTVGCSCVKEVGYKVPDLNTTRSAEDRVPIRGAHASLDESRR